MSPPADWSSAPVGFVPFSYVEMGAINTLDLFGLDELILFSFYWRNRDRYRQVVDVGANIGLHSVILGRLGFSVTSYEPDPHHVAILRGHLSSANVMNEVTVNEAAVGADNGRATFVRVLGNTTGSHVAGAKDNPYGDLEKFDVAVVSARQALRGADLVKMDVEGLEADLLNSLTPADLQSVDILCEVGSQANAQAIWSQFVHTPMRLFSQKLGWAEAQCVEDLPESHRDGSLFITSSQEMPWKAFRRLP